MRLERFGFAMFVFLFLFGIASLGIPSTGPYWLALA
jgi:hypothetical protein